MKPSDILRAEGQTGAPFRCMFGCAEFETCARIILEWLAANGDRWDLPVPIRKVVSRKWLYRHCHPYDGWHDFVSEYMSGGKMNRAFVSRANRDCHSDRHKLTERLWPESDGGMELLYAMLHPASPTSANL